MVGIRANINHLPNEDGQQFSNNFPTILCPVCLNERLMSTALWVFPCLNCFGYGFRPTHLPLNPWFRDHAVPREAMQGASNSKITTLTDKNGKPLSLVSTGMQTCNDNYNKTTENKCIQVDLPLKFCKSEDEIITQEKEVEISAVRDENAKIELKSSPHLQKNEVIPQKKRSNWDNLNKRQSAKKYRKIKKSLIELKIPTVDTVENKQLEGIKVNEDEINSSEVKIEEKIKSKHSKMAEIDEDINEEKSKLSNIIDTEENLDDSKKERYCKRERNRDNTRTKLPNNVEFIDTVKESDGFPQQLPNESTFEMNERSYSPSEQGRVSRSQRDQLDWQIDPIPQLLESNMMRNQVRLRNRDRVRPHSSVRDNGRSQNRHYRNRSWRSGDNYGRKRSNY